MEGSSSLKAPPRARSAPTQGPQKRGGALGGGVIVVAALVGIGRALLGSRNEGVAGRTVEPSHESLHDARGRGAEKPSEIPWKGWKDIGWRVYDGVQSDRILLVAAGVTFYALLALFPAIAAIVSLYGLFADATLITEHLRLVSGFLPEGALKVVGDQVTRIAAQGQGALGAAFLGTLALSLWGANAGTKAIFDALNIIYEEREKRGFIRLTLWSLGFTFGSLLLVMLALAAIIAVPVALKMLGVPDSSGAALLAALRWPLLYLAILFVLACLYRYGPSREQARWRWVSWGSAIAGAAWIGGSLLFSWYVASFGNYNATYGSLGAVIGFMVWMWLSTIVVLIGGEINAQMEHQTAKDTTQGVRKPMGARGARMADRVAETSA